MVNLNFWDKIIFLFVDNSRIKYQEIKLIKFYLNIHRMKNNVYVFMKMGGYIWILIELFLNKVYLYKCPIFL